MPKAYRGRLAPSPTGLLHLGHAHTFQTACQRARSASGSLILRIEDLDKDRSKPHFAAAIMEDLRWIGIQWDEGPGLGRDDGGPFAPYVQSQRHEVYRAAWQRLRNSGCIYPCYCSRRELAQAAAAPHEDHAHEHDDEPIYPGVCRPSQPFNLATSPSGTNWRFRVPEGEAVTFHDGHYGDTTYVAGRDFGDFLVWRRDEVPSYQLAVVVDDAAMHITEVVRGADLLKSTARQILLNRALGYTNPLWFHCDLVRDEKGNRLAKRHDALSLRSLRERGIYPLTLFQQPIASGR